VELIYQEFSFPSLEIYNNSEYGLEEKYLGVTWAYMNRYENTYVMLKDVINMFFLI
jgi:hypothetical protein